MLRHTAMGWLILAAVVLMLPTTADAQQIKLVKADKLSLREKPDTGSNRIEYLITFQPVKVLETKDKKWVKIQTLKSDPAQSKTGWVLEAYLSKAGFVSTKGDVLNVRRGPGLNYEKLMVYHSKNIPLAVLDVASNGWVKIMDKDLDRGWVHPNLLKFEPNYVITQGNFKQWNIREGIGTDNPITFVAEEGVIFQVLEEKEGWLKVKHADGDTGWMSSKIVFGWRDVEEPEDE